VLHIQVVSPSDRTDEVCRALAAHAEVANLVVLPDAARKPVGDVVTCEVSRGAANDVIDMLDQLDVDIRGSVVAERVDLMLGGAVKPDGPRDDAVVWEELQQRVDESSRLTWSYMAFLVIAVLIAAIGILQNSAILVIGAMVLGPEFGPVAALCFAILRRRPRPALRGIRTLVIGFAIAIGITTILSIAFYQAGWFSSTVLDSVTRETAFIVTPDRWSLMVALLAGVAGVLSLTSDKSQALVGVFISVTTVPAAAHAALAVALGQWDKVVSSVEQLGLNLAGITGSGLLTMIGLLLLWGHAGLHVRLVHHHKRLVHDGQRVDFDEHLLSRQSGEDRRTRRKHAAADAGSHELAVGVVHGGEVVAGGQVHPQHDDVGEVGAPGREDGFDILQRPNRLRRDVTGVEVLIGLRVDRTLTGDLEDWSFAHAL